MGTGSPFTFPSPPSHSVISDSMLPLLCIQITLILQQQEGCHSNHRLFTQDVTGPISFAYALQYLSFLKEQMLSLVSVLSVLVLVVCAYGSFQGRTNLELIALSEKQT